MRAPWTRPDPAAEGAEPDTQGPRRARKVKVAPRDGDGRRLVSDEEAHRDVTYRIPSRLHQTVAVFMVQMKLYGKESTVVAMIAAAVLIPVIMLVIPEVYVSGITGLARDGTQYLGLMLILLPVMVSLMASVVCGPLIGSEFKDRTAFINLSLPVSRVSFCIGKFAAGFVLCLGMFLLAYSMGLLTTMMEYSTVDSGAVLGSLAICVVCVFSFCATAFGIGAVTAGPTKGLPFLIMTILVPVLLIFLGLRYDAAWLFLLPVFLPDQAMMALGSPFVATSPGILEQLTG